MGGVVIFDPNDENIGLSVGDDQAACVYHDIETGNLYLGDLTNIITWEGASPTAMTYTWKSGKIRLPRKVNMGAGIVEAESYDDLSFQLFADINGTSTLVASVSVTDGEPFRLPGGYISNLYEVRLDGTDRVISLAVAPNIFELAGE